MVDVFGIGLVVARPLWHDEDRGSSDLVEGMLDESEPLVGGGARRQPVEEVHDRIPMRRRRVVGREIDLEVERPVERDRVEVIVLHARAVGPRGCDCSREKRACQDDGDPGSFHGKT